MRETNGFGIDLGTTHSAIAVAANGGVRVLKNGEGRDRTPCAVWLPREGTVHVGRKARERLDASPDDAHAGFASALGVPGAEYRFHRAGVSLAPEQLSAEILKSLLRDAAHELGEPPATAVITVPAGCSPEQADATRRAAALAGFAQDCPLLPEPVAAALGFGLAGAPAHRLVVRLDGGGFSTAVVAERDGKLRLLRHAGDPHLGGKDIDRAIVDELLAPAVRREFGLRDFVRQNPRRRPDFAKLEAAAEEAKVELSRAGTSELLVSLGDDEQFFSHTLTRGALDDLALPFYTRAVDLCRKTLADSSVRPDRVLLIGGATLAPGLREVLAGLGIPLDHSQDPTTVVARGAALHSAAVRRAPDDIAELRAALGRCEGRLDPGRYRTLVDRLQLTVDRVEDAGGIAPAALRQLLDRVRQFETALTRDPRR